MNPSKLPDDCCAHCKHYRESEVNPTTMKRESICIWGPPHVTTLPAPGGVMKATQFPNVTPEMLCGQFDRAQLSS